jgi:hypothetical protein
VQVNKLKLAKRLKDLFDIGFGEVEVQGTDVKPGAKTSKGQYSSCNLTTHCIAPWGALTPGGRLRFLRAVHENKDVKQ